MKRSRERISKLPFVEIQGSFRAVEDGPQLVDLLLQGLGTHASSVELLLDGLVPGHLCARLKLLSDFASSTWPEAGSQRPRYRFLEHGRHAAQFLLNGLCALDEDLEYPI